MAGLDYLNNLLDQVVGMPGLPTIQGKRTTTLTNAQILALADTGIELVPAPGTGRRLIFQFASLKLTATAGAYTESADNLTILQNAAVSVCDAIEMTGFIDQAAVIYNWAVPSTAGIISTTNGINTALTLKNPNDNFGGGNAANSLAVTVWYYVI